MHRLSSLLGLALLLGVTSAPVAHAATTLGCPTFGAAGGALSSGSFSGFALTAEPVVGVWAAPPVTCAAGMIACLEGTLSPLDVPLPTSSSVFALSQVAPNPTPSAARIGFSLPMAGHAELRIFDSAGRQIRTIARGWFESGTHTIAWDGRGDSGSRVAAGIYFCRLTAGAERATRRIVISR